jgi:hypothetical protein
MYLLSRFSESETHVSSRTECRAFSFSPQFGGRETQSKDLLCCGTASIAAQPLLAVRQAPSQPRLAFEFLNRSPQNRTGQTLLAYLCKS